MKIKSVILKAIDWTMNIFLGLVALVVLWFVAQLFFYASFSIPTDSMSPTLVPGDRIIVDKTVMGARMFDIFDALEGKQVDIHRTWGRGNIENGDIIVFNFPYSSTWDSIAMDIRKYYVKRCVASPGDTVMLRDCLYYINGEASEQLNNSSAKRLSEFVSSNRERPDALARIVVMKAFPNDSTVPWTVSDFGPMTVPGRGTVITLNRETATVYRNYIEWETGEKLTAEGDSIYLGARPVDSYRFNENYYFVAGDNVFNSQDSRYFGLLPEPFIVGKATYKTSKRR